MDIRRTVAIVGVMVVTLACASSACAGWFGGVKPVSQERATIDGKYILLEWESARDDADGYAVAIERADATHGFVPLAAVPFYNGFYLDSDPLLQYDMQYAYRMQVVTETGKDSKWVDIEHIIIPKPLHEVPVDVRCGISENQDGVDIMWQPTDEQSRVVIEKKQGDEPFAVCGDADARTGLFSDNAVEDEGRYAYRIYVAEDAQGRQSGYSAEQAIEYRVKRYEPIRGAQAGIVKDDEGTYAIRLLWQPRKDDDDLLVEIERRVDDGAYAFYATVHDSTGMSFDSDLAVGNVVLGTRDGCALVGHNYSYRFRYGAYGDNAASRWVEAGPFSYGVLHFIASPVTVESQNDRVAFTVQWQDVNASFDPMVRIERKVGDGDFVFLATLNEGVSMYRDEAVDRDSTYQYRLTWMRQGAVYDSESVLSEPIRYVPPEYVLPTNISVTQGVNKKKEPIIRVVWDVSAGTVNPVVQLQRSMNSRDFEDIAEVQLVDGEVTDDAVTHLGGSRRKQKDGSPILMNVYRYRLRCKGDGERKNSAWYTSSDVFVIGPA